MTDPSTASLPSGRINPMATWQHVARTGRPRRSEPLTFCTAGSLHRSVIGRSPSDVFMHRGRRAAAGTTIMGLESTVTAALAGERQALIKIGLSRLGW